MPETSWCQSCPVAVRTCKFHVRKQSLKLELNLNLFYFFYRIKKMWVGSAVHYVTLNKLRFYWNSFNDAIIWGFTWKTSSCVFRSFVAVGVNLLLGPWHSASAALWKLLGIWKRANKQSPASIVHSRLLTQTPWWEGGLSELKMQLVLNGVLFLLTS